jgi:two-component system cell cycle sensor histidine kinase/response regulator CckA
MKKKKVMIVEDEAIIALQIKSDLEQMGHTVTGTYRSGEEALARIGVEGPELILMDIRLQGQMDGIETAERIYKEYDIPVIFLTAHSEEAIIERATETGPYGYLLKPANAQELQIAIQIALYRHELDKERAQMARELMESEQRLRNITSNLGVGVYVLNQEGKMTFMNPMAEQLWGWSKDELNEQGPHNLVHFLKPDGTPLPLEECRMHGVIRHKKVYASADEVFVRRDGTVFPVSVISTPFVEDEDLSVTAFRDITVEKMMQEELHKSRKLESVGILAGGIAHDFNNLLAAIMGNIELAKMFIDENMPERSSLLLEEATKASEAAKGLSFRLLTFAKGGDPIRQVSTIDGVLRKSVALTLGGSNLTCHIAVDPELGLMEIDQGQMLQVINNILMNAKEAMPQGGTVTITAQNISIAEEDHLPLKQGPYVRVSIMDSGAGIAMENLQRIFDPYFSTKGMGAQKGTGLGLSICQSIIKKHDGYINVESQEGRGTTVNIYLPLVDEELAEAAARKITPPTAAPKILFMDDDELLRKLVANMMERIGYEAEFACNGEEAVEIYRRTREAGGTFAAVILDLTVKGGMGGDLAIKKLLEIDHGVQAVISSGYVESPLIEYFSEYGFVGAITKPYRLEQMKTLLDRLAHSPGGPRPGGQAQ